MIEVTVEDQALQDYLSRLQRRMGNLKPVMRSIATELETRVSKRFETQSDPNGQPWKAWEPATKAAYAKSKKGAGTPLLNRYGSMLKSLNSIATADTARIGFGAVGSVAGDVYAVYHEFGTQHMARRGLLFGDPDAGTLGEGDSQAMDDLLSDWLNEAIK
jgi:phage virion morphogenesis protein